MDCLGGLIPSFERSLRARNKAPRTISDYVKAAQQFADHLGPIDIGDITRGHVEDYIDKITTRTSAGHSASHYRRLQQFFRWLTEEGEIDDNPMRRMSPPHQPEKPVPIIPSDDIVRLVQACQGRRFEDRRDEAIVRLLLDCGLRSAELVGLQLGDVDFDYSVVIVLGKGRRQRSVPFGAKTSEALDRYLRQRRHNRWAELPALWLGGKGPLTASGVQQMIDRRCEKAGVPHIHLHRFRHTNAHEWLAAGGQEGDLERLMGWSAKSGMARHYAKSAADQRAREAHRRMGLGDRY